MIIKAFCKINLGLNVLNKRKDSYHDLSTIFYPINIYDIIEINKTDSITSLDIDGINIDCKIEENLIIKAFRLIEKRHKISNVKIKLIKNIPMGAGLGGGSSDASHTLILLNKLFDLNIPQQTLADYALELGSDCPYFIYGNSMFAKGRGEILSDIDIDLSKYSILLAKPKVHVSTQNAFAGIIPKKPMVNLAKLNKLDISMWKEFLVNDFESTIFKKHPEIKKLKEKMYEMGAIYSSMSGSGSSVYGIFPKDTAIDISLFNHHLEWYKMI